MRESRISIVNIGARPHEHEATADIMSRARDRIEKVSRDRIIDCTGATVARTSEIIPYATAVMNLNRRVVHMDGNIEKLDRMRGRCKGDVLVEDMREEAVAVITSLKPGLEVSKLIRDFEIETLPAYFDRSRRSRARHGGLPSPSPLVGEGRGEGGGGGP